MNGMSDEPKRRSWPWVGWAVIAAFVYPVSWGPAALLESRVGTHQAHKVFNSIYAPVDWARANSPTVDRWASWYAVLCIGPVQ
jgi:hypothetical protein